MRLLGIETSCDETAAAVVSDGTEVLSSIISSQVDLHARYGGIVPEVASRQHLVTAIPIVEEAMSRAETGWRDLDAIAVTMGPGLAGSLLVGVTIAKAIALAHDIPLVGINHLEGHVYASWLEGGEPEFPLVCLIVSGGHTDLILMRGHGDYVALGRTRDDAAGEAFDKVARLLGLPFPGGPAIEHIAASGDGARCHLPRAWLKGSDDFSFSGLKTAVARLVEGGSDLPTADIAAGFQDSVVDVLVEKTAAAAARTRARCILLGGGVAANSHLRQTMVRRAPVPVLIPRPILCTDNAAMIASCGYFRLKAGDTAGWDLDVHPNLRLA